MRSLGAGRSSLPNAEAEIMYGAVTAVTAFLKNARLDIVRWFRFIVILPTLYKLMFLFESVITDPRVK